MEKKRKKEENHWMYRRRIGKTIIELVIYLGIWVGPKIMSLSAEIICGLKLV